MKVAPPPPQHWVDIVPPAAPETATGYPVLSSSLMLLLAVIALVTLYQYLRQPRQRARRTLKRITTDLRRSRIGHKPACAGIEACLRTGFGHRRLQDVPWEGRRRPDWDAYLARLQHGCYAAASPSLTELLSLVQEAIAWLETPVSPP